MRSSNGSLEYFELRGTMAKLFKPQDRLRLFVGEKTQ